MILAGQVVLVLTVNLLTAWLTLITAFLYVVMYTPMKRTTWLNTSLGNIPGALPPVGGWAVATRHFDTGAWVLFAILFAWQNPHFYAIAWIFREDCRRGGFKMRPVLEEDGGCTSRHILAFSVLLIAVSILPTLLGTSGILYLRGAPDPRSRHVRHRRLVDAHSVHPRCPLPAAGVGRRSSIYLCCSSSR